MISSFIPLLASFLRPAYLSYWYYPLVCLAFIATVPRLIRSFLER